MTHYPIHHHLQHKMLILGFGSIAQAVLPLLFRHLDCEPHQIQIISKDNRGAEVAQHFGLDIQIRPLNPDNYREVLRSILEQGDFLLNLSVDVSSLDLIQYCQETGVLYLDASMETWKNDSDEVPECTLYAVREKLLKLKPSSTHTAVIAHGANPGLVSHFMKEALWSMANESELPFNPPVHAQDWAYLANKLKIKCIQIAERDTQVAQEHFASDEFVNTWSVDGLLTEAIHPAELGWGTHERHWPKNASEHEFGFKNSIYLNNPGAATRVKTWTPTLGSFQGYLITHAEAISISHYLSLIEKGKLIYRPTVHYAYLPSPGTTFSLNQLAQNQWVPQKQKRILLNEIVDGFDELGVLLMGNEKGALWYGSHLSIHEARQLAPFNNATSLQVAAGTLAGIIWALEHPKQGIVEPEEIDYHRVLEIARPYLGQVSGHYTDWTPLVEKGEMNKKIDLNDPWQFVNILG